MFCDEFRRMFEEMSDGISVFGSPFDGGFCGGMSSDDNQGLGRVEIKYKSPEQIFVEAAKYGLEKQVERLQQVVGVFYMKVKELTEKNRELQEENKQFQEDNRELADIVREREIEIVELQRNVEELNMRLDNALIDDNEVPANDETPAGNEASVASEGGNKTSSPDDSVSDGTADEVSAP